MIWNNITPRGNWYKYSWKGDENKSGGLLYNIGIHLFDLINFLFGKMKFKSKFGPENAILDLFHKKSQYQILFIDW